LTSRKGVPGVLLAFFSLFWLFKGNSFQFPGGLYGFSLSDNTARHGITTKSSTPDNLALLLLSSELLTILAGAHEGFTQALFLCFVL